MSQAAATPAERVEGFDVVRGLCALGVACYHMLKWQGLAELYNLGLYGVYIFFVLSGASLTVAYGDRFERGYPTSRYLAQRYLRLAPLFWLVTLYMVFVEARLHGPSGGLLARLALNVTFLFGVMNPGSTALATGAWSLGIEFAFYLVFPLLAAVRRFDVLLAIVVMACASQLVFVNLVIGDAPLEQVWAQYTQFGAFGGYFAAGIAIGVAVRAGKLKGQFGPPIVTFALWGLLAGLVAVLQGGSASASLTGARGAVIMLLSIALVGVSAAVQVPQRLTKLSSWLGDISYPLYLLHPLVFGALASRHLLQSMQRSSPVAFVVAALVVSVVASTVVFRWFEKPILAWGKARIAAIR